MARKVLVAGVGMVPFAKPGKSADYVTMGSSAVRAALTDARLDLSGVDQSFAGYVYGDSTAGQRVIYEVAMTGAPVFNVNNNCASGSSALYLARQAVQSGAAECALAFGFEQMLPGALAEQYTDRPHPLQRFIDIIERRHDTDPTAPLVARFFGAAGIEYQEQYGMRPETFAQIAVKSRRHAANNPYAVFTDPVTVEQVLDSPRLTGPLTRLQACPPTCGAAAAILVSEDFARRHNLDTSVEVLAQAMATDTPETFSSGQMADVVGAGITRRAASAVYEAAGVDPRDVDVVELHDCFTVNEILSYEALGLCDPGGAEKFITAGQNTYGGRVVVNPSGGLLSKGHPLGATGLAQCAELVWQLRRQAGPRQVEDCTLALQHNVGLGGAGVVTLYATTNRHAPQSTVRR